MVRTLALACIMLALAGCAQAEAAKTHTVIYNAEGDGARGIRTGSITLQSPTGTQQAAVNLPLTSKNGSTGLKVDGFKTGDFVYLSVQNKDASGSVTCHITVDGYVVAENTSVGGYTIATCKGQVPK